jgi:hypothetical protein
MLKFLARRRFNYIDILTLSIASGAFHNGDMLFGVMTLIVGLTVSVWIEVREGE